ncbi:MAG: hypothetical protein U5N56_06620 [Candidatus Marinimicrobia bacterium]|nr:hypothetical protein [Candidatus Neomarinimicrobiota bacterium]
MKRKWIVFISILPVLFFLLGCAGKSIESKMQDRFIKAEVETAVSMLAAVHELHEEGESIPGTGEKAGCSVFEKSPLRQ